MDSLTVTIDRLTAAYVQIDVAVSANLSALLSTCTVAGTVVDIYSFLPLDALNVARFARRGIE